MVLGLTMFWTSFLVVRALNQLTDIFAYIVIAGFFAVLLTPTVDACVQRFHLSRGWAALMVFLAALVVLSGLSYLFIRPIADRVPQFVETFPAYIEDVKHCAANDPQSDRCPEGQIPDLIRRFHLENRLDQFGEQVAKGVQRAKDNATEIASTVGRGVIGTLTVIVLLVLMLLHGAEILNRFISPLTNPTQERLRRVGRDCAHTVSSYMFGNVLISIIAGIAALVMLTVLGVKFKAALALWVAIADLIPLVGATIGAIPAIGVAFLHSTTAGIAMIVFFVVYQQFENHVLQVTVMSRTVSLDPLIVLVSVLIGVQLLGVLGAFIAIPVAGAIQVIIRDLINNGSYRTPKTATKSKTAAEES